MTLSDTETCSSDMKLYLYTSVSAFVGVVNTKFNSLKILGINNVKLSTSSMFHRAFFNSIIDKHQHKHVFIQHCISLEC